MMSGPLPTPFRNRLLACTVALLALIPFTANAQVLVDLSIKRVLYIAYEPLLATVRITNLSGNPLLLADVEGKKWFGFQIETLEGRPIPPRDPDYVIDPIQIPPGQSVARTVNLTQLYPLNDFGSYRVRASVYAPEFSGYFSSPPLTIEITEGRLLWQQTVGVPGVGEGPGSTRTASLLSHRLSDRTDLYLRVEDKPSGIVFCTHCLGDFISYGKPDVMLDSTNNIHVLQNAAPRLFIYSKVGLDGKILDRLSYQSSKERPALVKVTDGSVQVSGGVPFDPKATPTPGIIPKLSDRPVALPTPPPSPTPAPKGKSQPPPISTADPSTQMPTPTSPAATKVD